MGLFKKTKQVIAAKANAAVDSMRDPAKEVDLIILELEKQRKSAIKELLSYKASAKIMEDEAAAQRKRVEVWEKRAMLAVQKGDDELARKCLLEKRAAEVEAEKIVRDSREAAQYASELNASRKVFEKKLQMLKLKRGTLSAQIATARGKSADNVFDTSELMSKLADAERAIDEEEAMMEAQAELGGVGSASELNVASEPGGDLDSERELAEMKEVAQQRLLKEKT